MTVEPRPISCLSSASPERNLGEGISTLARSWRPIARLIWFALFVRPTSSLGEGWVRKLVAVGLWVAPDFYPIEGNCGLFGEQAHSKASIGLP